MSGCPECTRATEACWHGLYRRGCFGCEMRSFARSRLAADAVRTRRTDELRQALEKSHPNTPAEVALAEVWKWWRVDHPETEARTS